MAFEFDPKMADLIRRKARQLRRKANLPMMELGDFENTLIAELLGRLDRHPEAGRFVERMLDQISKNHSRYLFAEKRNPRRVTSLNADVESPDGATAQWIDQIGERDRDARHRRFPPSHEEQIDLVLDVADAIARVPASDRQVIVDLMKSGSVADFARTIGLDYAAARRRANRAIRILRLQLKDF